MRRKAPVAVARGGRSSEFRRCWGARGWASWWCCWACERMDVAMADGCVRVASRLAIHERAETAPMHAVCTLHLAPNALPRRLRVRVKFVSFQHNVSLQQNGTPIYTCCMFAVTVPSDWRSTRLSARGTRCTRYHASTDTSTVTTPKIAANAVDVDGARNHLQPSPL
jgi:hypothetical protein